MKIGIFGGSFNPPHQMHKKIAQELLQSHVLDKVIFVPTGNSYPKKDLIDATFRLEMLEKMAKNDNRIFVDDYECQKKSYTYQTLFHFQQKYPKDTIYFILGADNLKELSTWKKEEEILKNYGLIVIRRGDEDITKEIEKYQIKAKEIQIAKIKNENLSSSKIRKLVEEQEIEQLNQFLDSEVLDYILKHHLYEKESS